LDGLNGLTRLVAGLNHPALNLFNPSTHTTVQPSRKD
jgi:hypothetical protein